MEQKQLKKGSAKTKEEKLSDVVVPENEEAKEAVEATDKLLDEIDELLDQQAIKTLREQVKDEDKALALWDLMREGSTVSEQAIGAWTDDNKTCALSAAMLAARARGLA